MRITERHLRSIIREQIEEEKISEALVSLKRAQTRADRARQKYEVRGGLKIGNMDEEDARAAAFDLYESVEAIAAQIGLALDALSPPEPAETTTEEP